MTDHGRPTHPNIAPDSAERDHDAIADEWAEHDEWIAGKLREAAEECDDINQDTMLVAVDQMIALFRHLDRLFAIVRRRRALANIKDTLLAGLVPEPSLLCEAYGHDEAIVDSAPESVCLRCGATSSEER